MKTIIKRIPVLGAVAQRAYRAIADRFKWPEREFQSSERYWEERYAAGGNSGEGSYGALAEFKADFLNVFVETHKIHSIIEFGCGDGNQLALAKYPEYLGFDVSETAVLRCRQRFAEDMSKSFDLVGKYRGQRAELALSLDVIYHLVEDNIFEHYLRVLFAASTRYVIIYSTDRDDSAPRTDPHVRHRRFSHWVLHNERMWQLVAHVPNQFRSQDGHLESSADFFVFAKTDQPFV